MWKFQAADEWHTISLHDCRITNITEQNNNIILKFSDEAPYHVGCQIEFEFLKVIYEWNNLREDRHF